MTCPRQGADWNYRLVYSRDYGYCFVPKASKVNSVKSYGAEKDEQASNSINRLSTPRLIACATSSLSLETLQADRMEPRLRE